MDCTSGLRRQNFVKTMIAAEAATAGNMLASCGGSMGGGSTVMLNYWDWLVSQTHWVQGEINLFQNELPPGVVVSIFSVKL